MYIPRFVELVGMTVLSAKSYCGGVEGNCVCLCGGEGELDRGEGVLCPPCSSTAWRCLLQVRLVCVFREVSEDF